MFYSHQDDSGNCPGAIQPGQWCSSLPMCWFGRAPGRSGVVVRDAVLLTVRDAAGRCAWWRKAHRRSSNQTLVHGVVVSPVLCIYHEDRWDDLYTSIFFFLFGPRQCSTRERSSIVKNIEVKLFFSFSSGSTLLVCYIIPTARWLFGSVWQIHNNFQSTVLKFSSFNNQCCIFT